MAANNETRILKNNSVEELRQKTNEVSLNLGDNKLLDSRLGDQVYSYSASSGQTIFDDARIEFKIEETIDNTSGYIILSGSPTIPSGFIAGASLTQSGGYSATIVSASTTKILVKNSSGTLNTGQNLVVGSDTIAHANVVRIVTESYSKGLVTVTKGGTELVQDATSTNGFHIPNYRLRVNLTGSPSLPTEFTEGATLSQSGGFSGVLLSASSSALLFKSFTGTFSDSQNLGSPHTDASKRIQASSILSNIQRDAAFGTAIELNTPASASAAIVIKSTNLVDAITEVQDDIGDISLLNTTNASDLTSSINELEVGLRGTSNNLVATSLTNMTANNVVSAILEHETDIGNVLLLDDDSGYSATNLSAAVVELQAHLGTKASLTTTAKGDLVLAINEVDANADASVKLTSASTQTINSNINYTNGKTFTFPSGSTLDIRQGSLLTGSGGGELTFDTAFLTLTVNDSSNSAVNQFGLEGRRAGSGTDVRVQWNETVVSSKPDRAWQVQGLATDGTTSTTADIVTFYNAQDLIGNNAESGIAVTWDSTNQNFDFNVADPTLTFTGDVTGTGTLTNLGDLSIALTVAANSVALGTDTTGNYISTITGTANEITVTGSGSETAGVTLSLPDDVTIGDALTVTGNASVGGNLGVTGTLSVNGNTTLGNAASDTVSVPGNLTITGDLTVNGTNTILNTSTLEVEDTLILTGTSGSEPTTGGFGIETRSFTGVGTHADNASNVTGSHSIVYNFATDRWEADGSLILSNATAGAPNIEQGGTNKGDLSPDNSLSFNNGLGINSDVSLNGGASGDFDVKFDLQRAQSNVLGGIQVGYSENGKNYPVELSGNDAYVNVPWTDTVYSLPAAAGNLGGIKVTFTQSGKNYPVQLDGASAAFVNVPWTDTVYSLPLATNTIRGGIELFSNTDQTVAANSVTTTASRTYGIQLNASNQAVVNVPWVDTNTTYSEATTESAGLMSTAHHDKLDGIETGANLYSFNLARAGNTFGNQTTPVSGNSTVGDGGTLTIAGGSGIQVNRSATTITVQNSSPDTGTPAILSNSSQNPTLNTNITAGEVRSLIGAGTSSLTIGTGAGNAMAGNTSIPQGTVTSVTANNGASSSGGTTPVISVNTDLSGRVTQIGAAGNHKLYQSTSSYEWYMVKSNVVYHWFRMNGDVHHDGNVIAYSTNTGSDLKLKDNIVVIDGALAKVSQLKGVTFDWKDKKKGKSGGLIAQDVEKVLPTAVNEVETLGKEGESHKTVNYNAIIGLLVESVKELKAEIEELKKHK